MSRVAPRSGTPEPASGPKPAGPVSGAHEQNALSAGMRLGRYELLHPIASGGMAQVWAAEQTGDLGFRKLIALKTIRPDFAFDPTFRSMFLDEAQLASRIRHANVVEVLDLGVEGPTIFQAMTFVEGAPLSAWLNRAGSNRLPLGAGLRIAIDMLHGLHAAHELCDDENQPLGLVHRDVSPQNVLIGVDGIAKLADFGIAKAFGRQTEETTYGDVKGKLGYVAPELLDGYPATPQSDLFSAGVVLWEILTGRRLFKVRPGDDTVGARKRMVDYDPREVVPDLSGRLATIAMTALERDPYARFKSSLEMADALEEALRVEDVAGASHRHVAAGLESALGPVISELRETIRAARRGSERNLVDAITTTTEPMIDVTVGPTVTGRGSTLVLEPPKSIPFAPEQPASRGSAAMIGVALVLTALSSLGAVLLFRARGPDVAQVAPAPVAPGAGIPAVVDAPPGANVGAAAPAPNTPSPPTVDLSSLPSQPTAGVAPAPLVLPNGGPQSAVPPQSGMHSRPSHVRGGGRAPAAAPGAASAVPTAAAPKFESPY